MASSPEQAVRASLAWFEHSGVMDPADGSWGVGERVVVFPGGDAEAKIRSMFPAVTERGAHGILEHRRPDCNFQTALLFLAAGDLFNDPARRATGENILNYLFHRSGMRGQGADADVWQWHNMTWAPSHWFDDNGWVAALELWIARRWPALDARFGLAASGKALAAKLRAGLERSLRVEQPMQHGHWPDPEKYWAGEIRQPHWGTPPCLALVMAGDPEPARAYYRWLLERLDGQNTSEASYALLGAALAARLTGDAFFKDASAALFAALLPRVDAATGTLPSEHCEAPAGENRVDLVYTNNWFFAALAAADGVAELAASTRPVLSALARFLLAVQDRDADPAFAGCWRGMFDATAGGWGGGDMYEGGAGSIYTGWTNAPIALAMLSLAAAPAPGA